MKPSWPCAAAIGAVLVASVSVARAGWNETVLYSFGTGSLDGGSPRAGVVFDAAGNLYGTAGGGVGGAGVVFELTPPAAGKTAWTAIVLYNFLQSRPVKGEGPVASVIFDADGNLYSTTKGGGKFGKGFKDGTVFRLAPPSGGATTWTETVLHSFNGADGSAPVAGLVFDTAGNLYGTTSAGGAGNCPGGCGTVFKLAPPVAGKTTWTETVIHSFNGKNGANPYAGVVFGPDGGLYGTTEEGGVGQGTVFKLAPPADGKAAWTETVIHSFNSKSGANPVAGVVFDASGNLYGTTALGGGMNYGTVFELSPPAAGETNWTETVLHNFALTDGAGPSAGVVFDASGNLYGTTALGGGHGGTANCYPASGCGTAFKLAPPAAGTGAWTETVLARFDDDSRGIGPAASLAFDGEGNLYGTTENGGRLNEGAVFKLTP
jgi:uncharacterized repeat protein (TIGR03803 family)